MKKIAVLGAGRVGNAIVRDLAERFHVTAYDISEDRLKELEVTRNVHVKLVDLHNVDYNGLLSGFDLAVSAVPGFMGFETLRKIIESRTNVVDISFFPEDPFVLDEMAREREVCAIVDCGVAPGMGNIILGRYNETMKIQSYECLVGGLPVRRDWPFQYKAGFSPIDVIEEYVRPARFVRNGRIVVREALSDPELVNFRDVGTLEAFNTDGLRTLMKTMDIPDMIEKTLRYPGTVEYLRVLRDSGFFSSDTIEVRGHRIRPVDLTAELLFPIWHLSKEEPDITVMSVKITGERDKKNEELVYELYDHHDKENMISSMARTTGYTCTAAANLMMDGNFLHPGINPPEFLGREERHFQYILNYLEERKVHYRKILKQID